MPRYKVKTYLEKPELIIWNERCINNYSFLFFFHKTIHMGIHENPKARWMKKIHKTKTKLDANLLIHRRDSFFA